METRFLVIFTSLLLLRFGSSINITTSSNVTCIKGERESLLAVKQKITDKFNLLSTWSGVECCEWHGVGCDSQTGHIVKLDLRPPDNKYLEGELSPSLQNLKHLHYLDLSLNFFSGNIPKSLGSFERLEYLNLSFSGFKGVVPHHLGNLSRLQYLDLRHAFNLGDTAFLSPAPSVHGLRWVSSLSSLRYLDLSGLSIGNHTDWFHPLNMLPSLLTLNLAWCNIDIPYVKFVNFTSLNSLDLSLNEINSTIPLWLLNLTDLMHLKLDNNYFHGKIPDLLCNISSLIHLDLSFNRLSGPIPSNFGMLSRLEELNLHVNQLSGNIPMNLLYKLRSLVRVDLSENMFYGPISPNFGLLSRLEDLYLQGNRLIGNIPISLWQLSNLKNLDLSYNYLDLSLNLSSRWVPPFQLQKFHAGSCNIGPHFPNWLHTQTNLQSLDLSNSSIRDTMPGWFENILSHILLLDLSNNQINGKLPRFHLGIISKLMYDRILKLNSNKFEVSLSIFPSNVNFLDLSDNLLSGDLPQTGETMNLTLQSVNLSKNRFTGSIRVDLCKVSSITALDLSQNKLSGRLPECLGNLSTLEAMDLSDNSLTGVVPSSLGFLTQLSSDNSTTTDLKGIFHYLYKI